METTPFSNGRQPREVSVEEGQKLLIRQLLATVEAEGDIASEKTWQSHGVILLRHGQRFLQEGGMLPLLKLQQLCAEMVLKIRLAARKAPEDQDDRLQAFEVMMAELFAPEPVLPAMPVGDEEEA
jgi:hypothetical protein